MKNNSLLEIESWNLNINLKRPIIISGPCSAESEEQIIETAKELKKTGIEIFRAGLWKPRTRPNTFEGVGDKGLKWLKKVKDELGLLTCTEIASPKHLEYCLKNEIDIIWIGARTTANPFIIQEISDALRGIDIPVLIKNPINPDINLWIGSIERIQNSGINRIGLIHRGFSMYNYNKYRNNPQWQIPIEMKRLFPQLPMICDPSHITGNKIYIQEISQKALDLNYSGLMIESHINPKEALSDVKQQVTPNELLKIISSLIIRNINSDCENDSVLKKLREEINFIDDEIFKFLERRMNIASEIGNFKKEKK